MLPRQLLDIRARGRRLRQHPLAERRVVRASALRDDLNPRFALDLCGSHCGCLVQIFHASERYGLRSAIQGEAGRTHTII